MPSELRPSKHSPYRKHSTPKSSSTSWGPSSNLGLTPNPRGGPSKFLAQEDQFTRRRNLSLLPSLGISWHLSQLVPLMNFCGSVPRGVLVLIHPNDGSWCLNIPENRRGRLGPSAVWRRSRMTLPNPIPRVSLGCLAGCAPWECLNQVGFRRRKHTFSQLCPIPRRVFAALSSGYTSLLASLRLWRQPARHAPAPSQVHRHSQSSGLEHNDHPTPRVGPL